jgi:hypothetical protein
MRFLKYLAIGIGVLLLIPVVGVTVLTLKPPASRPPLDEKVTATPERLARGKYLAETVANCLECHSERDWTRYVPVVKEGTQGKGGECFTEREGVPGTVCAANITPDVETGIGGWTDGELMRAIREGVSKDGRALFGMMPYQEFRSMSDEDVRSLVVYLRALPPVSNKVPPARLNFPVSLFIKLAPKPLEGPVQAPPPTDRAAYGKYLTKIGACYFCHTHHDKGQKVGEDFAGGSEFRGGFGHVISANITPDEDTGIGKLTKEEFIGRFKSFATLDPNAEAPKGQNSVMPWRPFSQLTDDDLGMIFDHLRSAKPVKKSVNRFPDAPKT